MMPRLSTVLRAAVLALAAASASAAAQAVGDEEFVGPFPSWANAKTTYGAAGDGTTDDTGAIQHALDALGPASPTLYLPAGTYRITKTLNLAARGYVNVIGADPATTTILWSGPSDGTMLHLDGIEYSRFDRLTFNGQGKAAIAVDQSWRGSGNYFDTGNEYADDVFENAGTGFRCGAIAGCAETTMLRNHFINNAVAGIAMKNFNALDLFVWYSVFQNNAIGVGNNPGAGNFHVFNSIFEKSRISDISIGNTGLFNFRGNFSAGSNQFIGPGSGTNNPANITLQGNTILDTTSPKSIAIANLGPVVLLDNTIRSRVGVAAGPVVEAAGFRPTDLFSMGNTFTVSSPTYGNGHYHSVGDRVVARGTVNPDRPLLPGTPPNKDRQIFEVAPGSTAAQIQRVIDQAAAAPGDRPVVHINPGSYDIEATLVVPAGRDLQIAGDGYFSRLVWAGATAGPVMRLAGPSKAVLRDFSVSGRSHAADAIEVDNADQPGARVFMEQAILRGSCTNLLVDALDNAKIELHDFYHVYDDAPGMRSVIVTGGPSAAQGHWMGGATNIFAGASAGNYISYEVSRGAHVGVRDTWYDNGASGNLVADIGGASTFTYAGSALYLSAANSRVISFHDFRDGTAALLNLNTNGDIVTAGNGANSRILALGLVGSSPAFFADNAKPAGTVEFLNGQTVVSRLAGTRTIELIERGAADPAFLTATLDQYRKDLPTLPAALPSGVTDVRLYRVIVDGAATGIRLEPGSAVATTPIGDRACPAPKGADPAGTPTPGR